MAIQMPRKRLHFVAAIVAFIIAYYVPYPYRVIVAGSLFIAMLIVDSIRLRDPHREEYSKGVWEECLRPNEKHTFTGSFWLTLGFLGISFIPEKEIVCLAVIYVGFADPMADITGNISLTPSFTPVSKKTIGGSLGFFFTALGLSLLVLKFLFFHPQWLEIAFIGSFFATFIEALEIKILGHLINDNFLVPIASAVLLKYLLFPLL